MSDVDDTGMRAVDVAALFDRDRLRIARQLRGYSQVLLAREAGSVTAASLSQFENGHSRPSAATLQRLAVALRVPLEFFAAPARPASPEPVGGFFRSLRSTAPRDRAQALAFIQLARELALELEKTVALPDLNLPRLPHPLDDTASSQDVEKIADEVRAHWDIAPGPIEDVVRTLERNGIVVVRFRTSMEKVDAFCVDFPDRPVIALCADKGWRDRSRFDGAHELGHLIMHGTSQAGEKITEKQANDFGAAFLMPADDIRNELPAKADWPTLLKLKAKWHVSIAALLVRAKTLGVMDQLSYQQAWKALSVRGWRKHEPGEIGKPENPVLLRRALELAGQNGLSFGLLLKRAGLPAEDLRILLGDGQDDRPRVEL